MLRIACVVAWVALAGVARAAEYHGQVTFNGLPVPGAVVTATQGAKKLTAVSDQQGLYTFADLAPGNWAVEVEVSLFEPLKQEVSIATDALAGKWELKMLPLDQMMAKANAAMTEPVVAKAVPPAAPSTSKGAPAKRADGPPLPEVPRPVEDASSRASDGLLINGTSSNAATSQFTLAPAFGNTRSSKSLYNGSLGVVVDNSALDSRPYSLTGLDSPKASYNRVTGVFTFGGPIHIPRVLPRGPNLFVGYQWTRNRNSTILSGLVPDAAERGGDLSGLVDAQGDPIAIINPATGLPFAGAIPVSAQAQTLLNLYPLPNTAGSTRYNYQVPVISNTHQDSLQMRMDKSVSRKDQLVGQFALQSTRGDAANLFGFVDTTDTLGLNTNVNLSHRFQQRLYDTLTYRFSRLRTLVRPQFANRQDIAAEAGIVGGSLTPEDWGPPSLNFSSGIATLSDAQSAFNRNATNEISDSLTWNRARHNITVGGTFRRQQFNVLSQTDPRGTFTFTGAATRGATTAGGSDFADFLLGVPDTSSIAYGNADKYLRQPVYAAYVTDDWRARPDLTINAGLRWEYGAPMTELKGRLVNLDVSPGFSKVAPVLGSSPMGTLTGQPYPTSLIRPDRLGIEPRVGLSWRPIAGSTMVVRAGYGVYQDTSVYQATALQMAQQEPLSKSLSVQNSVACPLTLAMGFNPCSTTTAETFAVDPNFRVGYAQTWQLSVQRDLPGALVGTVNYLGIKGTRGVQQFLPNTYPIGGAAPCMGCPSGFYYRGSNGNSTRESGQVQLRRRLRSGVTATLQYTYSKSIDDDSVLGGQGPVAPGAVAATPVQVTTAQNWLNLRGERGLSTFDQRHLLNFGAQYTSGQGLGGGGLMSGWKGTLLKEWTVASQITAGSGLPETPIYLAATPGTGVTGSIRPNVTGAALYKAPVGLFLNPAAYTAPVPGQWGTAARGSINGPSQFTLNGSLARTFRLKDRYNLDLRVDSTNLLNHVVFVGWNTIVNGTTFGLPQSANAMRSMQTVLRLRY